MNLLIFYSWAIACEAESNYIKNNNYFPIILEKSADIGRNNHSDR
ncbi:hypothetical protein NWP21_12760 [Anabaenopsis sp. FSS-46]|nr:hypothetical protein [Anabaenopsis sp. FSS-46]MDH6099694.1 hypothetical protein [Anabaenopsis sp. FSS-46]